MSIYKHILLATDLSPASTAVSKKAAALAKLHRAELSIVHIVEYIPPFYGLGTAAIPIDIDAEKDLQHEARKQIKALTKELGLEKSSIWVLAGDKYEEIIHLIEKHHIDLIVVGAHHHHCLGLLFGGSLPGNMLQHLVCDIIVVNLGPL